MQDESKICAYFVSTSWDARGKPTNHVTFLDSKQLRSFVLAENPMREGFLQKYLPAKNVRHGHPNFDRTYQCGWTRHHCRVEERRSHVRLGQSTLVKKADELSFEEGRSEVISLHPSNKLHCR